MDIYPTGIYNRKATLLIRDLKVNNLPLCCVGIHNSAFVCTARAIIGPQLLRSTFLSLDFHCGSAKCLNPPIIYTSKIYFTINQDGQMTVFFSFLFHITLQCNPQTLIGMSITWDLTKMSIDSQACSSADSAVSVTLGDTFSTTTTSEHQRTDSDERRHAVKGLMEHEEGSKLETNTRCLTVPESFRLLPGTMKDHMSRVFFRRL